MKKFKLFALTALLPLAACDASSENLTPERPACGSGAAVTLEEGNRLCVRDTLVAPVGSLDKGRHGVGTFSLTLTNDDARVTELCIRDDDNEPHRLTVIAGESATQITAGGSCAPLRVGDHEVRLTHGGAGFSDPRGDVFHSYLENGGTRLVLSSNECRNCSFRNATWPSVGAGARGFVGDYQGADFSYSSCSGESCVLAGNFNAARLERLAINGTLNIGLRGVTTSVTRTEGALIAPPWQPMTVVLGAADFRDTYLYVLDAVDVRLAEYLQPGDALFDGRLASFQQGRSFVRPAVAGAPVPLTFDGSRGFRNVTLDFRGVAFQPPSAATWDAGDFTGANLTGLTMPPRSDLHQARFTGARLTDVTLADVDLSGAFFDLVDARRLDLHGTSLSGASIGGPFHGVNAEGASFAGADFNDATFEDLQASGASFARVTTRGSGPVPITFTRLRADRARFDNASFAGAKFLDRTALTGAVFDGATFTGAELQNATLVGASFAGANFARVTVPKGDFTSSTGSSLVLQGAVLPGALFVNAALPSVNLTQADLHDSHLARAQFCGGDVGGARLDGANLSGALLPAVDRTYDPGNGIARACPAIRGRIASGGIDSSATTVCPDDGIGPCATADRLTSTAFGSGCAPGPKKGTGVACTTSCDCLSGSCVTSVCQ